LASTTDRDRCLPCEDGRKLLALALILRVAWALWAKRFWGYHDDGLYDDGVYLDMARSGIVQNHPPGYPFFLAPFLALGDAWGISLARWAQMLLGAVTPVLTYRLALNLRQTRGAALIAGAFVALDPMLIYFDSRMMSESLFVLLVVAFLLAWLYAWQSGRSRDAAVAGLLGGAAALTRGVILPFGGVLALVALWRRREQPRWAVLVAVCGLCWAAAVAPWTARNWRAYHRFVAISPQGGWNLYEGLGLEAPDEMGREAEARGLRDFTGQDAYFGAKAKVWIGANPAAFARLCAVKLARFWRLFPEPPHGILVRLGAALFALVLFAGALLGLSAASAAPGVWFALAWVLHLNLLHAVFASNMRYRLPVEPVLAVLAGAGWAAWLGLSDSIFRKGRS
jgi:hypothetical protein